MNLVRTLIAAVAVAAPAVSFAQTDHALTRAEVRAQLVQLEQSGYRPASDNTQYPANLQAALARLDAGQRDANAAYGGMTSGSSAAGGHVAAMRQARTPQASGAQPDVVGLEPIYAHS
ncbi:DUF4148 domain-containing protein [Paraburkholderia silviterrae]|uniref:DUF4148 domain-containing protein n=1 Tax=Paraburkholderia silviterrae TaxID=2528715 RepID=A0A4R5M9U5_9BURK|nr:DUF4148 domain-containing protein [Paraburkholderia silviterrae]TDG23295.1 DUF4148 domain-containing protein [Paraburkholderia silviterrae]